MGTKLTQTRTTCSTPCRSTPPHAPNPNPNKAEFAKNSDHRLSKTSSGKNTRNHKIFPPTWKPRGLGWMEGDGMQGLAACNQTTSKFGTGKMDPAGKFPRACHHVETTWRGKYFPLLALASGPGRIEPRRAGLSRAKPSRARPSRAGPRRAEPSRPGSSRPGWAEPGQTVPSRADLGWVRPTSGKA